MACPLAICQIARVDRLHDADYTAFHPNRHLSLRRGLCKQVISVILDPSRSPASVLTVGGKEHRYCQPLPTATLENTVATPPRLSRSDFTRTTPGRKERKSRRCRRSFLLLAGKERGTLPLPGRHLSFLPSSRC